MSAPESVKGTLEGLLTSFEQFKQEQKVVVPESLMQQLRRSMRAIMENCDTAAKNDCVRIFVLEFRARLVDLRGRVGMAWKRDDLLRGLLRAGRRCRFLERADLLSLLCGFNQADALLAARLEESWPRKAARRSLRELEMLVELWEKNTLVVPSASRSSERSGEGNTSLPAFEELLAQSRALEQLRKDTRSLLQSRAAAAGSGRLCMLKQVEEHINVLEKMKQQPLGRVADRAVLLGVAPPPGEAAIIAQLQLGTIYLDLRADLKYELELSVVDGGEPTMTMTWSPGYKPSYAGQLPGGQYRSCMSGALADSSLVCHREFYLRLRLMERRPLAHAEVVRRLCLAVAEEPVIPPAPIGSTIYELCQQDEPLASWGQVAQNLLCGVVPVRGQLVAASLALCTMVAGWIETHWEAFRKEIACCIGNTTPGAASEEAWSISLAEFLHRVRRGEERLLLPLLHILTHMVDLSSVDGSSRPRAWDGQWAPAWLESLQSTIAAASSSAELAALHRLLPSESVCGRAASWRCLQSLQEKYAQLLLLEVERTAEGRMEDASEAGLCGWAPLAEAVVAADVGKGTRTTPLARLDLGRALRRMAAEFIRENFSLFAHGVVWLIREQPELFRRPAPAACAEDAVTVYTASLLHGPGFLDHVGMAAVERFLGVRALVVDAPTGRFHVALTEEELDEDSRAQPRKSLLLVHEIQAGGLGHFSVLSECCGKAMDAATGGWRGSGGGACCTRPLEGQQPRAGRPVYPSSFGVVHQPASPMADLKAEMRMVSNNSTGGNAGFQVWTASAEAPASAEDPEMAEPCTEPGEAIAVPGEAISEPGEASAEPGEASAEAASVREGRDFADEGGAGGAGSDSPFPFSPRVEGGAACHGGRKHHFRLWREGSPSAAAPPWKWHFSRWWRWLGGGSSSSSSEDGFKSDDGEAAYGGPFDGLAPFREMADRLWPPSGANFGADDEAFGEALDRELADMQDAEMVEEEDGRAGDEDMAEDDGTSDAGSSDAGDDDKDGRDDDTGDEGDQQESSSDEDEDEEEFSEEESSSSEEESSGEEEEEDERSTRKRIRGGGEGIGRAGKGKKQRKQRKPGKGKKGKSASASERAAPGKLPGQAETLRAAIACGLFFPETTAVIRRPGKMRSRKPQETSSPGAPATERSLELDGGVLQDLVELGCT